MNQSQPFWVRDAIFYQIFPDRFSNGDITNNPNPVDEWGSKPTINNKFGGDLQGILNHLDYLTDLGINAIYLNPILQANTNHKYDTYDYFKIDPSFGDEKTLRLLISECHRRGIRVVLDGVFNHCGYDSILFNDVKTYGEQSRYSKWFEIHSFPISKEIVNYQTCGGTWYLPKLNTKNPIVQDYLIDVAIYWTKNFEIDGWRLDVPWKIPMKFWRRFRERIKREFPETYLIGEIWRDPSIWTKGDTFDGIMNYALRNSILDYCVYDRMDAEDFNYELEQQIGIFNQSACYQLNILGSHDTPRIFTLCSEEINRMLLTITFLFTYIGVPMIYYGDEIGLTGGDDPDCRKCMPWNHTEDWNTKISGYYKKLIKARLDHIAFRKGTFTPLFIFNGVYAYQRQYENDCAVIILNPRKSYQDIKIPYKTENLQEKEFWCDLITQKIFTAQDGFIRIDFLESASSLVLLRKEDAHIDEK